MRGRMRAEEHRLKGVQWQQIGRIVGQVGRFKEWRDLGLTVKMIEISVQILIEEYVMND